MSARMRKAVGLTLACTLGVAFGGCDEPAPKCNIARGKFSVKYNLVSQTGTPECGMLTGDMFQVDVYYGPTSKSDPQPDLDHASAALQPATLTGALGRAGSQTSGPISDLSMANKPYVFGAFSDSYPKDGFCTIPTLSVARTQLPQIPAELSADMCSILPEQDPVDIQYTLSNVQVHVTADANGTEFAADLVYTTPTCSATYRVWGLSPYVSCGVAASTGTPSPATGDTPDGGVADASAQGMDAAADIDAGGSDDDGGLMVVDDGSCPAAPDPGGPQVPSDTVCTTTVDDPGNGKYASGISPKLDTICDPNMLTCVVKSEPFTSQK